jgi:hypothetical protein
MGCFNKSCVVTGLQITHNDPIVGIKLKKTEHEFKGRFGVDFDHITSEWYPIEFPVRGIYDDYGRIEVNGKLHEGDEDKDYDGTRCDDYMFIHEWAYDLIQKRYLDGVAEASKNAISRGYTDWELKNFDDLKKAFKEKTEGTDHELIMFKFMQESAARAISDRWFQSYFAIDNKYYWFKRLYIDDYDEFVTRIKKFQTELSCLEEHRFEMGFQWRPSYVASQWVDYDLRLGLLEEAKTYLINQKNFYGE